VSATLHSELGAAFGFLLVQIAVAAGMLLFKKQNAAGRFIDAVAIAVCAYGAYGLWQVLH
jgi:hypothetical protein